MTMRLSKALLPLIAVSLNLIATCFAHAQVARIQRPKLVVVIAIDQFRADQVARFQKRFLPASMGKGEMGGFRYLLENGAYFPFAEYGLLQNMTCPGHATILSGAYAYQHGIAINDWVDGETGKTEYCVEDSASPLVGEALAKDKRGISPKNLQGSTFGDELKNSGYRSRSITIALKDRSAVLLGGHRNDLALWFDVESNAWISSTYYLPDGKLPPWVQKENARLAADKGKAMEWTLPSGEGSGTSLPDNKLILPTKFVESFQREFPHKGSVGDFSGLLLPYGTKITIDAAVAALDDLGLGQGPDPDLLAVSFSNHDFIGHTFGPNSRELEETILIEDREIGRLLSAIQKRVGLQNTIVVLTADHGAAPQTEWLQASKQPAGRVDQKDLMKRGEDFLQKSFGKSKDGPWLLAVEEFNFYLNYKAIKAAAKDLDAVQDQLARYFRTHMSEFEGIASVFSGGDVRRRELPGLHLAEQILKTYRPGRSGDVVMIPKPYYVVPGSTATHLSAYAYDRMVPLLMAGPQIKAGVYGQKVEIIDIAPTLAFFAGTTPPSGSEGRVLHEILRSADLPSKK